MNRPFLLIAALVVCLLPGGCKKQPVVPYGQLEWKDESFFLNGKPFNGIAQDKHANGQMRAEYPMKNGKPHGVVREWWDNGQPSTETHFENGQRHGSNRYWNREGRLLKEQEYDHDKSISEKVYPTPAAAVGKKDP
ncbi:MAG: hypothetical protein K1X78_05475 [Verrucomicrobiaceae bacterium]|nr:hypothetical protein [Verrucomicrobiaceae bacterium]